MSVLCIGDVCPTDTQIDAGWTCKCGDDWSAHEVDMLMRPARVVFVLSRCHRCETRQAGTVLEARIAREPLRAP